MAFCSHVVLLVLLLHHGSCQLDIQGFSGSAVTGEGEHETLAYGQLLEYVEGLKNDTQRCCEAHWTVWTDEQQQSFAGVQTTLDDQALIMQQQQTTIQQQQTTINQLQSLLSQLSDKLNGPRDCMELLASGHDTSGVYTIYPDGGGKSSVHVYCDMDTDGGGWTLFQKRQDGSVNFYQDWQAYKTGFGDLRGEFWLGNDHLHRLTAQDVYELRVDLEDFEGNTAFAKYNIFRVGDEVHKYRLTISGYSGTAGDGLTDHIHTHDGTYFSTRDGENDNHSTVHCAQAYKGGWWYNRCHHVCLNGQYLGGVHQSSWEGVNWYPWKGLNYSLKTAEMKIRPN
ncbi:ficolin-1-like [Branchiostoma lanceolatum]|uniref:ficolin-1-like n=1 Tax=Branchiostoma lanceolatum TaxID=7740 RepID=UPI0034570C8F